MSNVLIALGLWLWTLSSLFTFILLTRDEAEMRKRIIASITVWNFRGAGLIFGTSILRLTGILWILVGILLRTIGVTQIQGMTRDIFFGFVILIPIWVGAILLERRRR